MKREPIIKRARPIAVAAAATLLAIATVGPVMAAELTQECTNPEAAYSVDFPDGWFVNGHVEGGGSDDVAACRFFSPEEFEVRPAASVGGIAIAIGSQEGRPPDAGQATTVGGRPAVVIETVAETDGFEPAGTRHYSYWIELGAGEWLVADTSDGPAYVGDYDENKATLDAMMDSLAFAQGTLPNTAAEEPEPTSTAILGWVIVVLAVCAVAAPRPARRPA